jgi:hypothetical protein
LRLPAKAVYLNLPHLVSSVFILKFSQVQLTRLLEENQNGNTCIYAIRATCVHKKNNKRILYKSGADFNQKYMLFE